MTYTADWSDEIPIDHTKFNQTPGKVRDVRISISDRLKNLFYGFIAGETQASEGVKNLPFHVQAADPSATADKVRVYSKDEGGKAGLFMIDEDENIGRLVPFRSGDMLLSSNTTTPPGFTDVSSTYGDKFIRISSSTPLETGGVDTHDHGSATGSHTLTTAQIPSHTHTITHDGWSTLGTSGAKIPQISEAGATPHTTSSTGSAGSGEGHTHTVSSANNIPAYVQMKLYKKD